MVSIIFFHLAAHALLESLVPSPPQRPLRAWLWLDRSSGLGVVCQILVQQFLLCLAFDGLV